MSDNKTNMRVHPKYSQSPFVHEYDNITKMFYDTSFVKKIIITECYIFNSLHVFLCACYNGCPLIICWSLCFLEFRVDFKIHKSINHKYTLYTTKYI